MEKNKQVLDFPESWREECRGWQDRIETGEILEGLEDRILEFVLGKLRVGDIRIHKIDDLLVSQDASERLREIVQSHLQAYV